MTENIERVSNENSEASSENSKDRKEISVSDFDYDSVRKAIIYFANTFSKVPPASKAKDASVSFVVDDDIIRDIDQRIEECFASLDQLPYSASLSAKVMMPDGTEQIFDNLDRCLRRAGDRANPIKLNLAWERRLVEPVACAARFDLCFDTALSGKIFERISRIAFTISGPSEAFVEEAFSQVYPVVESCKIQGVYLPLLAFKHQIVCFWASGIFIFSLSAYPISNLISQDLDKAAQSRLDKLNHISESHDVATKIDLIAKHIISPELGIRFIDLLIGLAFIMSLAGIFFGLAFILSKLAPKSYVAIGLAKKRYIQNENAFRFVIFTVLLGSALSGIILPAIRYLIGWR